MNDDTPKTVDVRVADALDRLDLSSAKATARLNPASTRDWLKALSLFGAEHPATLGCLLALVREAWGNPTICTRHRAAFQGSIPDWVVNGVIADPGATEAEALVAALEAAP